MQENHEEKILAVHLGRSANCSSIGSVVDVLFVSGVVGAALLSALAVMLRSTKDKEEKKTDESVEEKSSTPEQP